ncbi:MAG TPA: peroxiredoxin [Methanomassiliicoccales archaeon]|nr:peroxiredoxin [Methanomassiliicoccales archaeon]
MGEFLQFGQKAPDFELMDQDGRPYRLSERFGSRVQVVYFYPKDGSPICTKESMTFREMHEQFQQMGAEVVGISADDVASHKQFSEELGLPFRLLSDEDNAVRRAYGASSMIGPGRVTFVIDRDGVVRHSFSSMMMASKHAEEAMRVVKELLGK